MSGPTYAQIPWTSGAVPRGGISRVHTQLKTSFESCALQGVRKLPVSQSARQPYLSKSDEIGAEAKLDEIEGQK